MHPPEIHDVVHGGGEHCTHNGTCPVDKVVIVEGEGGDGWAERAGGVETAASVGDGKEVAHCHSESDGQ